MHWFLFWSLKPRDKLIKAVPAKIKQQHDWCLIYRWMLLLTTMMITGEWWHTYTEINKRIFRVQFISFQVIPGSWLMLTYSSKSMPRNDNRRHAVRLFFSCPKKIFEMLCKPVLYSTKQVPEQDINLKHLIMFIQFFCPIGRDIWTVQHDWYISEFKDSDSSYWPILSFLTRLSKAVKNKSW